MNGYCVNAGKVSYDECDLCNPPCSVCGDRGCHEMYTMGGELICSSCDEWWNCGDECENCEMPDGCGKWGCIDCYPEEDFIVCDVCDTHHHKDHTGGVCGECGNCVDCCDGHVV